MSGHKLAQIPHCLHFSGNFTTTFPVSREANTSAGQNATHRPQLLHHASKMSIGSVRILSGKGTFFFRTVGRDTVACAIFSFSLTMFYPPQNPASIRPPPGRALQPYDVLPPYTRSNCSSPLSTIFPPSPQQIFCRGSNPSLSGGACFSGLYGFVFMPARSRTERREAAFVPFCLGGYNPLGQHISTTKTLRGPASSTRDRGHTRGGDSLCCFPVGAQRGDVRGFVSHDRRGASSDLSSSRERRILQKCLDFGQRCAHYVL